MRKLFLLLFVLPFALSSQAQFGYYSSSRVLKALPQYVEATADYERLCQRCDEEIESNEKELTRLYVAFLDGQRDFPEPILRKRQNELQQLVDNSVEFRKQLKVWLVEAKDSLYASSYQALEFALERVCTSCDLDYAIDTDVASYGYINPNKGVNITNMLIDAAINQGKPATMLDGYDDFVKRYRSAASPTGAAVVETAGESGATGNPVPDLW